MDSGLPPADGGNPDGGNPDGGTPDGGTPDGGNGNPDGGTLPDGGAALAITTFGVHGTRDSLYVDPAFTKANLLAIQADGGLRPDPAFTPAVVGDVYASPLFLENGLNGKDVLFVATEENNVYAIDAAAGTVLWNRGLDAGVPNSTTYFGCGNIDPLGITGTPVLDVGRRELVLVGTLVVDAGTAHHIVYALSIDDGHTLWSIDLDNTVTGFNTYYQGQRAGLLILNDVVYISFGGYDGDCGDNWGYVMGIPLSTAPAGLFKYQSPGRGAAIWAPNGIATDGTSVFAVTGNGEGSQTNWSDGDSDALLRLDAAALTFSNSTADFWVRTDWQALSGNDKDLASNGTTLFELPGAGSGHLALVLGKLQSAYLIDRANMGGITDTPLAHLDGVVATGDASGGMATYATPSGRYVVYNAPCPNGNGLGVLKVTAGNPPTVTLAFCANQGASGADQGGSPIVTTSDGTADAVVWGLGAYGDNRLHAVDGDDGGTVVTSAAMPNVRHWVAPRVAKGSIYVPVNGRVYAFRVQ